MHVQNNETKKVLILLCVNTSTEEDIQLCLSSAVHGIVLQCGKVDKCSGSKGRWTWIESMALKLISYDCGQVT